MIKCVVGGKRYGKKSFRMSGSLGQRGADYSCKQGGRAVGIISGRVAGAEGEDAGGGGTGAHMCSQMVAVIIPPPH